jgi:oxygen-independent coproporphyrinogen-3 oxidase
MIRLGGGRPRRAASTPGERLVFDRAIVRRYDRPGPRYTSYPTANLFEPLDADRFSDHLLRSARTRRPLSLYFHLPFCRTLCLFCACNVIWTNDRRAGAGYVDLLCREMDAVAPLAGEGRPVQQLHWGGGTPTHLPAPELERLFHEIRTRFTFASDAEIGVEINPGELDPGHLETLALCGFNRASLGVQDFDPDVQAAVRRVQPEDRTRATLRRCRALEFASVNVDLIYGLPRQTRETFARTVDSLLDMGPDRIALYSFAYLPERVAHHRAIGRESLPTPEAKLDLLESAIRRLGDAGYVHIGMDHFARPDDELAIALGTGALTRNFQGYSTKGGSDLLGIGVSAISQVGRCYAQNPRGLAEYRERLASDALPVARGVELSDEDVLRRDVIQRIMCHLDVRKSEIASRHGIDFDAHFAESLRRLAPLEDDGLVENGPDRLRVTPAGRLLMRNIAMCFDAYLEAPESSQGRSVFSRTV